MTKPKPKTNQHWIEGNMYYRLSNGLVIEPDYNMEVMKSIGVAVKRGDKWKLKI